MNRSSFRYAIPFALILAVWGCGQKGARLQKSVVPPDKTLYETGEDYLKKSQFIKARLAFQTLISTYPDSDVIADAYLSMGDSFYNEGGTENLLQAEDRYKDFIVFFPTHPRAPDAQMKIISANMKMMHAPDRDQQYTVKAWNEIKKMLDQFPDSDFVPIAQQLKVEVEENLAQGNHGVGTFYFDKGNFLASSSRYKEIVDNYQSYSQTDEVLFRLAQSFEKLNNKEEAAVYLTRIAQGFPFSKRFEEAKSELKALGKPVPEVDTKLAAINQSHLKPSRPFSPLRPFIDFAQAIGFMGPPDRYEAAKKTVETRRAEAATIQADAAKAAAGEKAGEDALIQGTLIKDITGKTQVTTVLGGNPRASQATADKTGDTKNAKKNEDKNKKSKKPPSHD